MREREREREMKRKREKDEEKGRERAVGNTMTWLYMKRTSLKLLDTEAITAHTASEVASYSARSGERKRGREKERHPQWKR